MSMPWFRLYNETVSDPKIQTLDLCSKWMWVTCLCIASASCERGALLIGNLPATSKELASVAGISEKAGQTAIEKLIGRGMLIKDQNTLKVKNWDTRQFESDGGSKERVRRYRERMKKNTGDCNGYMKYRDTVIERDNGECVYCGSRENLCIDHIVPIVLGGDHEPDNLATACKACNSGKSGRLPEQAGYTFKNPAVEKLYKKAKSRLLQQDVTVTVTSQNTDNRIQIKDIDTSGPSPQEQDLLQALYPHGIELKKLRELMEDFSDKDIRGEFRSAREWLDTPKGKKIKSIPLFLRNWLKRAEPKPKGTSAWVDENKEALDAWAQ